MKERNIQQLFNPFSVAGLSSLLHVTPSNPQVPPRNQ